MVCLKAISIVWLLKDLINGKDSSQHYPIYQIALIRRPLKNKSQEKVNFNSSNSAERKKNPHLRRYFPKDYRTLHFPRSAVSIVTNYLVPRFAFSLGEIFFPKQVELNHQNKARLRQVMVRVCGHRWRYHDDTDPLISVGISFPPLPR